VPSVSKVELERKRLCDVGAENTEAQFDRAVEPVSFTNIVHSPSSPSVVHENAGTRLIRRLWAFLSRHLFVVPSAERDPTLLEFTERFNR